MADADSGSFIHRAVAGAVDATVGRMEDRVVATTRGVIDDLEPYLVEETVPRILDALVPQLVNTIVPEILDGVTDHVVKVTAPEIIEGLTPALADELIPILIERMRPMLEAELVPAIVDALTPHLIETTAPAVINGLMPMIRNEVVPSILDDIADDPRMRDLIREQSLGLVWDGFETARQALARGDDLVDETIRRIFRITAPELAEGIPVGRSHGYAGAITRGVAVAVDLVLIAFVTTQGLSAALGVLRAISDPLPTWLVAGLTFLFALTAPIYFTFAWRFGGRTVGSGLTGYAVTDNDGGYLRFGRCVVRAVLAVVAIPVWVLGFIGSARDSRRRNWLDKLVRSQTPYRVHLERRTERDQSTS